LFQKKFTVLKAKQMKLFIEILLFIFTMILITVGDVKSSTVVTIFQEETSYAFFQKPHCSIILFENHNANSCLSEGNVVTCSEQVENKIKNVAKGGDDLLSFMSKSLSQKLDEIAVIWKTKYPIDDMLGGRTFFEKVMREYRYTKAAGWEHTADIASNFKGVDFYKGVTQGERIYAETAVSMKTTTVTSVDDWLIANKGNIDVLANSMGTGAEKGIKWSGKTLNYNNAELHIYVPKENLTPQFKSEWINKLSNYNSNVKYQIDILEDFIK
jgi:hypothetical protein